MLKFSQEEVNTANFKSVQGSIAQINQDFINILRELDRIIVLVRGLLSNYEYVPQSPNFQETEAFKRKILELKTFIEEQKKQNLIYLRQPIDLPPAPSEKNDAARGLYNDLKLKFSLINRSLREIVPQMSRSVQLLQASYQEEWTKPLAGILVFYKQFLEMIKVTQLMTLASLERFEKFAYPLSCYWHPIPEPANMKLWKETKTKIDAFKRAYTEYTFPQVLYHFTKDWDMFERFKFKKWYKYNSENSMNNILRVASDFVVQDRVQKLSKKKKQLQSRVDSAKKILREMISSGLLEQDKGNKIFKILAMLEYEILQLSIKTASARMTRATRQIEKLGCLKVVEALKKEEEKELVKTAEVDVQRTTKLLKSIKEVLNNTDYSKNLDKMYHIKKELEDMGRTGDTESILKIIKDELDGLDKLNKKLVDVYVNLSRLPIEEMTKTEDEAILDSSLPQKVKMPLTVEDDVEIIEEKPELSKVIPKPIPPKSMPKSTPQPTMRPLTKSPIKPLAPKIEKDIPNV